MNQISSIEPLTFVAKCRTDALDAVFVESVALVTATGEAADAVLAASIVTHVGEVSAFVDIFAVDVAGAFRTQFFESGCSRFWTRVATVSPGFADGAATDALQVVTFDLFGADAVPVVQVTRFLTLVDAARSSFVQGQSGWTGAGEGSFRVDTDAASFTNARIQVAFVDIRACFAVHLSHESTCLPPRQIDH